MWRQGARPMYPCALALNSALLDKQFRGKELHAFGLALKYGSLSSQKFDNNGGVWVFPTILFDCHFNNSFQGAGAALSPTWRDMYLTSPPTTTGMLELHPGPLAFEGPDDVYLHLQDHTGITLGLVYDTIFATFEAQYGDTLAFGDVKHFLASLHFACVSASLGTSILVRE
jgi:hypothetical protein